MKLLLILFLSVGCSVSKYYRAPEVATELKKNEIHLKTLTTKVQKDFQDKEAFLKNYAQNSKGKNSFLMTDLAWRLQVMKEKKETILSKSSLIKEANTELLNVLGEKSVVKEGDPEFKKIEKFSNITDSEGKTLISDYQQYQSASQDFVRFALFTGNVIRRQ